MTRGLRFYRTSARRDLVKYTVIITPGHLVDPVQSADVLGYMRDPELGEGRRTTADLRRDGGGLVEAAHRRLPGELDGQGTGDPYIVYIAGGGVSHH